MTDRKDADDPTPKKATARRAPRVEKADPEAAVLAAIAEMEEADRALAERLHAIVRAAAPGLAPKLWYGMPAYTRDGKVVCFFQAAGKFKTRFATFGFQDAATLDDGPIWPVAFGLTAINPEVEAKIAALLEKAVG
jgi:uncharacterized protein YdhG (YjbR/CyaY superfamily)